jgi:LPXTG-motif cell wall-anchored protein
VVLDAAREGLRVDSAVASAGNWDSTENRWVIPTLESGKQIELIVDAVAEIDGLLAPAAFVRAATPDNNGVNNTAIGSIAVVAADQPLPADDGSWLVPGLIALGLALLAGLGGWWLWTRRRNR